MENRKNLLAKALDSYIRNRHTQEECIGFIDGFNEAAELLTAFYWNEYDKDISESHPPKPDKYFVCRKDGKVHWETWNGISWAYNNNEIRFYAKIHLPIANPPLFN